MMMMFFKDGMRLAWDKPQASRQTCKQHPQVRLDTDDATTH